MPLANFRVALLGQYGVGNLGNEGSLDAFLALMRAHVPSYKPVIVAQNADRAAALHAGVPTIAMSHNQALPSWLPRAVKRILNKLLDIPYALRTASEWDALVVAGSGTFEQLGVRPGGLPWDMFRLAAATRLRGGQFVLFGVGAERNAQFLNRVLMRATIRLASVVTVRDEVSRDSIDRLGVRTDRIGVHPDVVFALDTGPLPERCAGSVAVGVMAYYGIADKREQGEAIHTEYAAKTASFVAWLLQCGYSVTVTVGDHIDYPVAVAIAAAAANEAPERSHALAAVDSPNLTRLGQLMAGSALAVATRFHNVVIALKTGTPVISLSYGPKNDALIASAGLRHCAQPIEGFDLDQLKAQFCRLADSAAASSDQVVRMISGFEALTREAFIQLWLEIGPNNSTILDPQLTEQDHER
jgi:polysaccharide pyruvyl transferase WcaK-like protein